MKDLEKLPKKPQTPYELFGVECGEGWEPLYAPVVQAAEDVGATVFQIKEKFGQIRIYLDNAPNWLKEICQNMEHLSAHVCEECGRPGKLYNRYGRMQTICDNCYKAHHQL